MDQKTQLSDTEEEWPKEMKSLIDSSRAVSNRPTKLRTPLKYSRKTQLPNDIQRSLLSRDQRLLNLNLLMTIADWKIEVPGFNLQGQTHVVSIAHNNYGLAVLGVEENPAILLNSTINEIKNNATETQLARIHYLEKELGLEKSIPGTMPYRLLTNAVSLLLTARTFYAHTAVLMIYTEKKAFCEVEKFEQCCELIGCVRRSNRLWQVPTVKDRRLMMGWCLYDEQS